MRYEKQPDCMKPACGVEGRVCPDCAAAAWKKPGVTVHEEEVQVTLQEGETVEQGIARALAEREAEREVVAESIPQEAIAEAVTRAEKRRMDRIAQRVAKGKEVTALDALELGFNTLCSQYHHMGKQLMQLLPLHPAELGQKHATALAEQFEQMGAQLQYIATAIHAVRRGC